MLMYPPGFKTETTYPMASKVFGASARSKSPNRSLLNIRFQENLQQLFAPGEKSALIWQKQDWNIPRKRSHPRLENRILTPKEIFIRCPIPLFLNQRKNYQRRSLLIPQGRPHHLII